MSQVKYGVAAFTHTDIDIMQNDINTFIIEHENDKLKVINISLSFSEDIAGKWHNAMLAYSYEE